MSVFSRSSTLPLEKTNRISDVMGNKSQKFGIEDSPNRMRYVHMELDESSDAQSFEVIWLDRRFKETLLEDE